MQSLLIAGVIFTTFGGFFCHETTVQFFEEENFTG